MKKILTVLIFTISATCFANTNSIGASIDEAMINQFLSVVETLEGKSHIRLMGAKTKYDWKINNMNIDIELQGITFTGDVDIDIFGQNLSSPVTGLVNFRLDKENDEIVFKVEKLVPGKKSIEDTIDLSKMYSPEFSYKLPKVETQNYEMELPNGEVKKIMMNVLDKSIELGEDKIFIYSQVEFQSEE